MTSNSNALFLGADGAVYSDALMCSGVLPAELEGKPCPYSQAGRIPGPVAIESKDSLDRGDPGDLCPPCAKQQLGNLGHWQGHNGQTFPEELLALRLFKCRMCFWLVIPGLHEAEPTKIDRS